jgi:hypothetical protein
VPLKTFPPGDGLGLGEGLGFGDGLGDGLGKGVAVGLGDGEGVGVGVAVGVAVGVGVGVAPEEFRMSRTRVTVCCMAVLDLKSVMNSHQKTPPMLPA